MEQIISYFDTLGLDLNNLLIVAGLIALGVIILSLAGRFIFGKKSTLVGAVSSAIGIIFVYALNIVLRSAGAELQQFISPLPFISISGDELSFFSFAGADYTAVCYELINLIILAFLMNLIDRFMPKGKNIITWIFFRTVTVLLAQVAYLAVNYLMTTLLPEGILTYAPVIVLAILLLMLLTGALKVVVGLVLTTVNPLIAALYTFFFANVIGKQVTKAVLTTGILSLLVFGLEKLGITTVCIAAGALTAYIPLAIILLVLWIFVSKLF
ncbi:MAG: hypothetical protein IJO28_00255 [Oscillospiraceae bacterium]|nr:hypothetical protein [Oscillospiraceae bacterium]